MNKIIIIIIVVIVILGGYFIFSNTYQLKQTITQKSNQQPFPEASTVEKPVTQVISQPSLTEVPTITENLITYTDSGYSPNVLTIKKGDTVTFKNQSSQSMWPASAMHPTHRVYSGTSLDEHCPDTTNSAFDACTGILPGGLWSFKFDKPLSWKYHDHLSPSNFGTIIVE